MESYETRQDVDATADTVWGVLVDGARYDEWVPGVVDVEGDVADGQTIRLLTGDDARDVTVRISAATNRRLLRWESGAPLGMYTDLHAFELAETQFGCTVVLTRELLGPLEGLLGRATEDAQGETEELAKALRAAAEAREGGSPAPIPEGGPEPITGAPPTTPA
ncbi:SRPBCC family protein [Arthrobacter sp. KK5.5]|uniref:SRPBCC family protein n=1 Tax=Arthrobacter sp. KK5.5 TaxID=3373084 RepID=UPI003EE44468